MSKTTSPPKSKRSPSRMAILKEVAKEAVGPVISVAGMLVARNIAKKYNITAKEAVEVLKRIEPSIRQVARGFNKVGKTLTSARRATGVIKDIAAKSAPVTIPLGLLAVIRKDMERSLRKNDERINLIREHNAQKYAFTKKTPKEYVFISEGPPDVLYE